MKAARYSSELFSLKQSVINFHLIDMPNKVAKRQSNAKNASSHPKS
ncbi:hypothetical protein PARC_p0016 (plasmid) [Pseudoalteromonas arctica A 37-1-2]|uniref:Uncharacterized protein n=1 Tax=Pseudoalteromonas arctica A 37-1-2 TaxID=1117313 RepID=A0A290SA01_9GAMM|nr:hypothetical protein PARC_p0016 [Pseudoalteromonas arctica A 37-1-2]